MFGGFDGLAMLDETWEWNGTAWSQLAPAASPSGRVCASIAYDPVRDRVVLFGGDGFTAVLDVNIPEPGTDITECLRPAHGLERSVHLLQRRLQAVRAVGEVPHLQALDTGIAPAADVVRIGFDLRHPLLIRGDHQATLGLTDTTKGFLLLHALCHPVKGVIAA